MTSLLRCSSVLVLFGVTQAVGPGAAQAADLHAKFTKCDYCACQKSDVLQLTVPAGRLSIKLHIAGWMGGSHIGYPLWIEFSALRKDRSGWDGGQYLSNATGGRTKGVSSKMNPENPKWGADLWYEEEDVATEPFELKVQISSENIHDGSGACHQASSEHWFTIDTGGSITSNTNSANTGQPKLSNGYAVDNCLNWGANCGKPAADQYCKSTGYPAGATTFATAKMQPTWVMGDNRACNVATCIGFTSIQCAQGAAATTASPKLSNGYFADQCLHWGTSCGKPAADQYCRSTGHPAGATTFTTANMQSTWVMGDNRVCNGPACVGFTSVQCAK